MEINEETTPIELADTITASEETCLGMINALPVLLATALPAMTIEQAFVRPFAGGFTYGKVKVQAGEGYLVTCACEHGEERLHLYQHPDTHGWEVRKITLLPNRN